MLSSTLSEFVVMFICRTCFLGSLDTPPPPKKMFLTGQGDGGYRNAIMS